MRVLIIEDEPKAAQKLKRNLLGIDDSIQVVAITASVLDSVVFLSSNKIDLILSDINLSDGLSFEIFETLEIDTPVIFTTAYDNYAINAFKTNSIDYLLKPIKKSSLEKAIDKYRRLRPSAYENINIKQLVNAFSNTPQFKKRFLVEAPNGQLKSILSQDIAYFYAEGKYTFVMSTDNKKYFSKLNISKLQEVLDPAHFFQLNRSYFTSIGSIDKIIKYSKSRLKVILDPPTESDVIVSYERVTSFKSWLDGSA